MTAELLEGLVSWRMLAAACAVVVAGLMRGYAGFGTAILLAPIFSVLWGPRAGIPILLIMEMLVSVQLVPKVWRQANQRVILPLGLAACLATPFGAYVLLTADGVVLKRVIGALVLVFGVLILSPWRYRGTRPLGLNIAVGTVSGLMKGATGMSGPPVILYLLSGMEAAREHRANLILFFATIAIVSVLPPLIAGLIDLTVVVRTLALLPVMLVAVPIGARLFHVVPERWYRRFAFAILVLVGAIALIA
ncbi:sulfite exporter TauE/SafE family protein [Plastoroseomonas arctica]|uniref:Probable membrane transporter protein n=1 Tax=Plastoroseomonas arctica TaxID=1509237 RepID=A0AAF1JX49_9PROT|nr:sulfite exporter TauE/SafE family protein [Plastoroseomonas arctica]MBR0655834.1 sulfite exporter TauE/SafE family protein [Plastoroseomonas arctica]